MKSVKAITHIILVLIILVVGIIPIRERKD